VSGSDEEATAYLARLEQRTQSLIPRPDFFATVETTAMALQTKRELTGDGLKRIIQENQIARSKRDVDEFQRRLAKRRTPQLPK
jgi:stalled ribosome rescue protein Dom34